MADLAKGGVVRGPGRGIDEIPTLIGPGWVFPAPKPLSERVAETNARLAAEGRCIMHNSWESRPARYLMELPIGNVVPLCVECCDWWRDDASRSGDPMTQPVQITEIPL